MSEGVRLNACRDVLDRAGFKPVERQEISHVETSSIEELEQELKALLN